MQVVGMKKTKKNLIISGIAVILLLALDQITKYLAVLFLRDKQPIPIIKNVFELQYLENRSAAFESALRASAIQAFLQKDRRQSSPRNRNRSQYRDRHLRAESDKIYQSKNHPEKSREHGVRDAPYSQSGARLP